MKPISATQKAELYKKIDVLKIERPDLTILEISNFRTKLIDELSFIEASALLERFKKSNQTHFLTIEFGSAPRINQ